MEMRIETSLGYSLRGNFENPNGAQYAALICHGANYDMDHSLMVKTAEALKRERVASVRFNFGYVDGKGRKTLECATSEIDSVVSFLNRKGFRSERIVALGKSFGGGALSLAAGKHGFSSLIIYGYPIKSASEENYLKEVSSPTLFIIGGNDELCNFGELKKAMKYIRPESSLKTIPNADHSYYPAEARLEGANSQNEDLAVALALDWVKKHMGK